MSSSSDANQPGPWPEPDDADAKTDVERSFPEAQTDQGMEARGSKGTAIAVAGLNVVVLTALPVLLVIGIYTYITGYALVKAVGSGSDAASPTVVLLGVVGLVTVLTALLGVGIWAIGRMGDPTKRRA